MALVKNNSIYTNDDLTVYSTGPSKINSSEVQKENTIISFKKVDM